MVFDGIGENDKEKTVEGFKSVGKLIFTQKVTLSHSGSKIGLD